MNTGLLSLLHSRSSKELICEGERRKKWREEEKVSTRSFGKRDQWQFRYWRPAIWLSSQFEWDSWSFNWWKTKIQMGKWDEWYGRKRLHRGWKASAVCFPISFLIQWPKSFPGITQFYSPCQTIRYIKDVIVDRGWSAQRGPACRGERPRGGNREGGSAAAWTSPCPPPAKKPSIWNVQDHKWMVTERHLDGVD